jgi:hypothetical protein
MLQAQLVMEQAAVAVAVLVLEILFRLKTLLLQMLLKYTLLVERVLVE